MRSLALPLLTSVIMAAVLLAHDGPVAARVGDGAVYLLVMISAGAATYTAALLLLARRFVAQQIRDFKRLLPGASAKLSRAGAA
jgi:hypothetical protein